MANANARFGTKREHQVRDVLRDDDWLVIRTPGSKGAMDLIAIRDGNRPRLVQVKGTAAGPFSDFGPAAREKLRGEAKLGGADALLAWWPKRGKLHWFDESEWP